MAWIPFDSFLGAMGAKTGGPATVDLDGGTFRIAILTNTYTPNRATHDYYDDLTNEVSGTGYTGGVGNGLSLATPTWTVAGNVWTFDAADPATISQNAGGFSTGRHLVLYHSTGVAGTSPLIAYHTAGADFGNVAGDLTVQLAAGGIFTLGT